MFVANPAHVCRRRPIAAALEAAGVLATAPAQRSVLFETIDPSSSGLVAWQALDSAFYPDWTRIVQYQIDADGVRSICYEQVVKVGSNSMVDDWLRFCREREPSVAGLCMGRAALAQVDSLYDAIRKRLSVEPVRLPGQNKP